MKSFCFHQQSLLNSNPKEDFCWFSSEVPIFCVADGVTLNFDGEGEYPKESAVGEAAKIFCQTAVREGERRYDKFSESDILEIFLVANDAVRQYNLSCGLKKDTINFWDKDFFSVTTAFALVKNSKIYWWSLCDSAFALLDSRGTRRFLSPDGWKIFKKNIPQGWEQLSKKEKTIMLHRDFRNSTNPNGELCGYGVANGEESAALYLERGIKGVRPGDKFLIFTDGFENYIGFKEFLEIFREWPNNLQNKLEDIVAIKSKEDSAKFGSEKTLIAVSI